MESNIPRPRLETILSRPWLRVVALALFYIAILVGLILLYGKGNFSTPGFIYQGF